MKTCTHNDLANAIRYKVIQAEKNKDEVAKRLDELNQDANDLLGSEEW